jgi:hypothetical protein
MFRPFARGDGVHRNRTSNSSGAGGGPLRRNNTISALKIDRISSRAFSVRANPNTVPPRPQHVPQQERQDRRRDPQIQQRTPREDWDAGSLQSAQVFLESADG